MLSVQSLAGNWIQLGTNWAYTKDGITLADGWIQDSGKVYYVDPSYKLMVTGWRVIDNIPYFFGDDGALWIHPALYLSSAAVDTQGKMLYSSLANNISYNDLSGLYQMKTGVEASQCNGEKIDVAASAEEILSLVNEYRTENGKAPLKVNDTLSEVAKARAVELSNKYTHTRPDGSKCFTLYKAMGYNYTIAGENIACGHRSAEEVFNTWKNSDGHRKNMLGDFRDIGIGIYESNGVCYWCQSFGNRA